MKKLFGLEIGERNATAFTACLGILYIILIFFVFACSFYFYSFNNTEYEIETEPSAGANIPVCEITSGVEVVQTIPVKTDISEVQVLFATYARTNSGVVSVRIQGGDSGICYADEKIDAASMQDNRYVPIEFMQEAEKTVDSLLLFIVTTNCEPGNGVTIWKSKSDALLDGELFVNGIEAEGDLVFRTTSILQIEEETVRMELITAVIRFVIACMLCLFVYQFCAERFKYNSDFHALAIWCGLVAMIIMVEFARSGLSGINPYRVAFLLAIVTIGFAVIYMRKSLFSKPETLFMLITLVGGGLLCITMPITTNVSWDDQIHFDRTIMLLDYFGVTATRADVAMVNMSYPRVFDIDTVYSFIRGMNQKYAEVAGDSQIGLRNVSGMANLAYIPPAFGIIMFRILQFPYYASFIAGRISSLLCYSAITYFAIRETPIGKRIMMVTALFPTNLFLASNYSCDTWTTAFTMLWIAMLLDEIKNEDKMISKRKTVLMLLFFFMASVAKGVYAVLGVFFFMMPKKKFQYAKGRKRYYLLIAVTLLVLTLSIVLPRLLNTSAFSDLRGGTDVNSYKQMIFILKNPVSYTCILLNHLKQYLSLSTSSNYMTFFAYLGLGSNILLIVLTIVVTVTDRNDYDLKIVDSRKNRLMAWITLFAATCLISTALYISFTPVALERINGVQPRYLLPLIYPCLVFAGTGKIQNKIAPERYNAVVAAINAFVLFSTIWSIYLSKYCFA